MKKKTKPAPKTVSLPIDLPIYFYRQLEEIAKLSGADLGTIAMICVCMALYRNEKTGG